MTKSFKTLMAASALAAVTMQANAAVTNYTTVVTGWQNLYGSLLPPSPTTPGGYHFLGSGTASYDDVTNILTYQYEITFDMSHAFPLGPTVDDPTNPIYPAVGTWNVAGTMDLAAGTGNATPSNCDGSDYKAFCDSAANSTPNMPWDFVIADSLSNPTVIDFGLWEALFGPGFRGSDYDMTLTAVPVPAAAWLFGSALLGLAGVARRRN